MYIDWSSRYGLSSVLEKILVFKLFFYSESSMHGINFTCLLRMQWNVMDEVEVIADSFLEEHKKYTYMYSTWACSSIHWINLQCRFFVEAKGFEENVVLNSIFLKNSSSLGIVSEIFSIRHLTYLLILTKIRSLFLDWFRDNFESRSNNLWFGIYIIEHSHIHILAVGTYLFIWSPDAPDFLMSLVTSASDLTCMFSNCMRSIISIMGPR